MSALIRCSWLLRLQTRASPPVSTQSSTLGRRGRARMRGDQRPHLVTTVHREPHPNGEHAPCKEHAATEPLTPALVSSLAERLADLGLDLSVGSMPAKAGGRPNSFSCEHVLVCGFALIQPARLSVSQRLLPAALVSACPATPTTMRHERCLIRQNPPAKSRP